MFSKASFWLKISLFNLLLVALLGLLLRYKMGFDFAYFDHKFLLHSHSHFAFSGWITHTLMVLMLVFLSHQRTDAKDSFLKKYNPSEIIHPIGDTGIIAVFKGQNTGPKTVFRCELDALPIQESNEFNHKSIRDDVSHKCGHDGHTVILCGVASLLSEANSFNGTIYLLFQH